MGSSRGLPAFSFVGLLLSLAPAIRAQVKPEAYLLRPVVRDSIGQLIATQNGVVEIQ